MARARGRLMFSRPLAGEDRYWMYPYVIEAGTRVVARRPGNDWAPIIMIVTQSGEIAGGPGPAQIMLEAEAEEHGPQGNIAAYSATMITHPPNLVIDQNRNWLRVGNPDPFFGGAVDDDDEEGALLPRQMTPGQTLASGARSMSMDFPVPIVDDMMELARRSQKALEQARRSSRGPRLEEVWED